MTSAPHQHTFDTASGIFLDFRGAVCMFCSEPFCTASNHANPSISITRLRDEGAELIYVAPLVAEANVEHDG